MIIVSVLYPKTASSSFDLDYYVQKHTPFVKQRLESSGMQEITIMRGVAMLDGGAPQFEFITQLTFPSIEHLQDAVGKHGAEIFADIPNFTSVQPVIQVNEALS